MKILITSSRRPSRRTRTFLKDLALLFNAYRFNRGKSSISDLLSKLKDDEKLIIIDTKKGNPSRIRVYFKNGIMKNYIIRKVKLFREIKQIDILSNLPLPLLIKDDFSKEFAFIFNLNTDVSKSKLHLELDKIDKGNFQNFYELVIKDDFKTIANLFLIKEWNGKRSKN